MSAHPRSFGKTLLSQFSLVALLCATASLAAAQQTTTAPPAPAQNAPPPPAVNGPMQVQPTAPVPQAQQTYQAPPPPPPPQQGQYYTPPPPAGAYPQQQQYAAPQPYAAQPYVAPPNGNWQPVVLRPKRGMMIAGASILGGSYLISMLVGAALLDNDNDDSCSEHDCRRTGRLLFVPVIGPFAAMSRNHDGNAGLLFLGVVELVGAGLMVGGIVRYKNSKRSIAERSLGWDLSEGRRLSFDVTSSARGAGPRMRLDF